jgi:hypothetical protein
MDWMALKHALLAHLPVAAGLLLPWPLLAAQRPGRGIRPWWTVVRYIALLGGVGLLLALVSGLAQAHVLGLVPAHKLLPRFSLGPGPEGLLFRHAVLGAVSVLAGAGALWALNRSRKDHQSLGLLALALGLLWCTALLVTGENGYQLAHGQARPIAPTPAPAPAPVIAVAPLAVPLPPRVDPDPESRLPIRALDFTALEPIHGEPVKSPAHGGRWIRAWASPSAAAAYRAGQPLPSGALVVLSTVEDRWGRPGTDPGPLYALDMQAAGPSLMLYWPRIPADQRKAFGGETSVYWRGKDARLESCQRCHAAGMADLTQRSRWRAKKILTTE